MSWISVKDRLPKAELVEVEVELDKAYHQGLKDGAPQWISVKDRLPEDEQETVLVLISGNDWHDHDVAYHALGKWYDKYDDAVEGVTHWQELPEPPKEEG